MLEFCLTAVCCGPVGIVTTVLIIGTLGGSFLRGENTISLQLNMSGRILDTEWKP